MEWKIKWRSGCYDEIELVYEKARNQESLATLLSGLEEDALGEAEEQCIYLRTSDGPLTREAYHEMPSHNKELVLYQLGLTGLAAFEPSMKQPVITATFSPLAGRMLACTLFNLINRLEKLDGSYNTVCFPKGPWSFAFPLTAGRGLADTEC